MITRALENRRHLYISQTKVFYSSESSESGLKTGMGVERREEELTRAVDLFFTHPQHSQCNRLRAILFYPSLLDPARN